MVVVVSSCHNSKYHGMILSYHKKSLGINYILVIHGLIK